MKNNNALLLLLNVTLFFTFFAGIIRHDVNEEEYLKLALEKQFECVGQVYKDSSATGSCVLIGERFVLSAAHVLIDSDNRPDTTIIKGKKTIVYNNYNHRVTDVTKLSLMFNGQKVKVKEVVLHPYYLDSLTKGTCDIALFEIEEPIKNISPAKLNIEYDELNENVIGVGFGASGPANRPDLVDSYDKKIAGENVVDSIGGANYLGFPTLLFCDFDHPTRKDCNKFGSATPRPLEHLCSGGDSGGGLFRLKENNWELIGICSGSGVKLSQLKKTGYYGQIMKWTRVSVFTKWLSQTIK